MRRFVLGLAVVLGLSLCAGSVRAQVSLNTGFSDPFFLYYGFYLPRQAALAAQPRPEMIINQQAAAQGYAAITNRGGLYEPIEPLGGEYDPLNPFANRTAGLRNRRAINRMGRTHMNLTGQGPAPYFSRTAGYYPSLGGSSGFVRAAATRGSYSPASSIPSASSRVPNRTPNPMGSISNMMNPMNMVPQAAPRRSAGVR